MQPVSPPAPPPPPPLLPPPPPPPPPAPGLLQHGPGFMGRGERRRSRMRNFNWETLPKHTVMGKHNIWTADKTDGEYELDTDHMEELFSHSHGQQHPKVQRRQTVRGHLGPGSGGQMVSLLSSKRSMNIGIFLKQFKRPVKDLIEEIKSGRGLGFGTGKLRELCKMLPDEGEMKQLVGFKGDPAALPEADLFMLMLIQIPSYVQRLNCLVLKEEFFPLLYEMKDFIHKLATAGKELLECDNLHSVIRLVLRTGNYMNAGGYAGSAIGFRMSSLLKLADTKANKPGMNLMHYVVMQAQRVDVALLKFPEQLKHIESAARINKGEIEAEFERLMKKIQKAKTDTLKQEDLKEQMEAFLKKADACLAEIKTDLEELQSVSDSVAEYFCEDSQTFKLEECCSIFHSFCEKFLRAMQENKSREMAEIKRKHLSRLQITNKRRSTATCSSRDKEMDSIALEYMLQSFLTSRNSRRKSERPSLPNASRSPNGSLPEITSQTNLPTECPQHASRTRDLSRKEWNSAAELTGNVSHNDKNTPEVPTPQDAVETSQKQDFKELTHSNKKAQTSTFTVGSFSPTPPDDDGDEEDLKDNSEEEAQKLREASIKVLQYQNSHGSSSSVDYSVENPRSPPAKRTVSRQLTFDEETQRYPGDPTNEDLVRFLLGPQSPSKPIIARRHTVPTKAPKDEGHDSVLRQPNHLSQMKGFQSRQVTDSDGSKKFKKSFSLEQSSPSAEKKSKPSYSPDNISDCSVPEPKQEDKSVECNDSNLISDDENVSKSVWFKAETSGFFSSFFKRLGDLSKPQNIRETVYRGPDSSV